MKLIKDLGTDRTYHRRGIYECPVCAKHFEAFTTNVNRGLSTKCKSCGTKKHGMSKTALYYVNKAMIDRCNNKNNPSYKYYGGKGVIVCEEWCDFKTFYKWAIDSGYRTGLTIDRIDSRGNYEPINCRWITQSENTIKTTRRENFGRHLNIKISIDDASEICEMYDTGRFTYKEIGKGFNVTSEAIGKIIREGRECYA